MIDCTDVFLNLRSDSGLALQKNPSSLESGTEVLWVLERQGVVWKV